MVQAEARNSFKHVCREEKSVDVSSDVMEEYKPEDVYKAYETAIFYRLLPDKPLEFKNVHCHGGRQSKETIAVLDCANMSCTDKLPLYILGKSANLTCFKKVKSWLTGYDANKKAWMTGELFTKCVVKFDKKYQRQRRREALTIDN